MKKHLNSKQIILLIFSPILLVLIVVGFVFGIKFNRNERHPEVSNPINEPVEYTLNNIFLIDNDKTLVPLTIKHISKDSKAEELMYILSCLKVDNEFANQSFNGILPKECNVKGLSLENNILNINFDDGFKTYSKENELRLLESLVWTFTDLNYVDGVTLSLNDQLLKNMPVSNTPLSYPLTRKMGINNYLLTSSILGSGQQVLSYYEKKIDQNYYYVPVTHYVSNKDNLSLYDLTINALFKDPGITSSLDVCRCFSKTKMVNKSLLTDNILYVSLTEDILFDEASVSLEIYKLIKEVTSLMDEVKDVAFLMDLEEVKVNGFDDEQTQVVASIELNKYYI